MVILGFDNRFNGYEVQNNDSSPNIGPKLALWGTVLSALGDTIQVIGGAIAIEESNITGKMQQQQMDKIQKQLDEIQRVQANNNINNIDLGTFNHLLERMVIQLEDQNQQKRS